MENKTVRVRRMGSVTFGVVLVAAGILWLMRIILPAIPWETALRFWPVALISLGVEVLLGSRQKTQAIIGPDGQMTEVNKVIYDVPAIVMTVLTLFLLSGLAWVDWAYMHRGYFYR